MILVCPPRSGSEWFMGCLTDSKYVGWEILNNSNRIVGTAQPIFNGISFGARMSMLRTATPIRSHKILTTDLLRLKTEGRLEEVLELLGNREDVYYLGRANVRALLVSFFVAFYNSNYHLPANLLTRSFTLTKDEVTRWYDMLHTRSRAVVEDIPFVEELVYERLLAGEKPKTLGFDTSLSQVKPRNSHSFTHLFNYEEVVKWFDELEVPGG